MGNYAGNLILEHGDSPYDVDLEDQTAVQFNMIQDQFCSVQHDPGPVLHTWGNFRGGSCKFHIQNAIFHFFTTPCVCLQAALFILCCASVCIWIRTQSHHPGKQTAPDPVLRFRTMQQSAVF